MRHRGEVTVFLTMILVSIMTLLKNDYKAYKDDHKIQYLPRNA